MTILEQARAFLEAVQPKGAAVYLGDFYLTIGAWRIVPGLLWFYEAGGDNTQHEHFVHVDEFRFNAPHFLSFYVDGEHVGGVMEMETWEKEECKWERYQEFLDTEEGQQYIARVEERADRVYLDMQADLN